MLSKLIGNFGALHKASGIPIEPLDPVFFQEFPISRLSSQVKPADPEKYQAFLKKLTTEIIPAWASLTELPRVSLRPLLELVDDYFKEASGKKSTSCFSKQALAWAEELQENSSPEERKCLFGQTIQVGKERFYLIEILARCLEGSFSDEDKGLMLGIARWLCLYDASLIGCSKELEGIYAELKIGPAFNITSLRAAILALPDIKGGPLEKDYSALKNLLMKKEKIDFEVMDAVLEFFRLRWQQMLDDEISPVSKVPHMPSYLVLQGGINKPWRRLAETLAGAGWLKPRDALKQPDGNPKHLEYNYFAILMPTTAGHNTDPLTLKCVTNYDLYHFILSDNNQGLILFGNSIEQFETPKKADEANKFGCYHNSTYNRPFTKVELGRIEDKLLSKEHPHAVKRFQEYFPLARAYTEEPDTPIYKSTVGALIELVNASTFANALQYGEKYNKEQMKAAGAAYHRFYNFMHKSGADESDELVRLKKQRIRYEGLETTFGKIIYDVEAANKDDGCVAGCNKLIIALILSYMDTKFSPEVERIIERDKLRETPGWNVFRDYDWITEEEAKRRILILLVSIMSHYFQYPYLGRNVSIGDCSNTTVDVTYKIFQLLSGTIINGSTLDFEHSRYMYAKIMESVVKPAVNKGAWYADTQRWINSVADGSLFEQKHAWFKPEVLLATLAPMVKTNPAFYCQVGSFLDSLVSVYLQQDQSSDFKELRLNIKFAQVLQSVDPNIRAQLLDSLVSPQNTLVKKADFVKFYIGYVIQRLAHIGVTASEGYRPSLFSSAPAPGKAKTDDIAKILSGRDIKSIGKLLQHLGDKIATMSPLVCNERGKQAMRSYLSGIKNNGAVTIPPSVQRSKSPTTEFFTPASFNIPGYPARCSPVLK